MRVSTALVAAGIAMTAGLLLTACGSSGSKSSDKIQGGQTVTPAATATATASPTATPAAGRPAITLPSYAKNVFEDGQTGDPKKDAVLADNEQRVNSIDEAILKGSLKTPGLAFYSSGKALASADTFITGYTSVGDKWAGTTRYFARKVTFMPDGSASLIYCSDESKSWITHPNKPVVHTPTTPDSYVLYNTRLVKNAQAVWQTTDVLSKRGARECQP